MLHSVLTCRWHDVQIRCELGVSEEDKLLIFMYGGHTGGSWKLHDRSLPPGWRCVICSNGKLPPGVELPSNFLLAEKEAYTPDLVRHA